MDYILKKVFQKLWMRKRIYTTIILQLVIGFIILNTFFSLRLHISQQLDTLLESNKKMEFYITAAYINNQEFLSENFDALTWGNREPVINEYPDIPFSTSYLDMLNHDFPELDFELETLIPLDVFYADGFVQYTLCYNSNYTKVKMSKSMYDNLRNPEEYQLLMKREFPFQLVGDSLITLEGEAIPIEFLSVEDRTIYIPARIYNQLFHPKNLIRTKLNVRLKDSSYVISDRITLVMKELEKTNKLFSYSMNSDYYNVLNKVNTAYEQAAAFNFIGLVLFSILFIGVSGLFALIINTRKKEIAINLALGATKKGLYTECLLEMLTLLLLGWFLGTIISIILLVNGVSYATVTIKPSIIVIFVGLVISGTIALIATIPAYITIKTLMPMEILRTE